VIVNKEDGWYVISKKGKNLGGPYPDRAKAVKRLQQVEYFKKQGSFDKAEIVFEKIAAYGADLGDYWDYFKNVARHKKEVYEHGRKLDISPWTLLKHDIDKLSPERFMRYAEWYHGPEGILGTKNPELKAAKKKQSMLHKLRSGHHSYLFNKQPSREHQLETITDWFSAMRRAKNYKDETSFEDYISNVIANDRKNRFSKDTKTYIKKKLREM